MFIPVFDDHVHLDPHGRNREAVRDFLRSGGTGLMVVNRPYGDPGSGMDADELYRHQFETTLKMAAVAREAGAMAWAAVGPYPADLVRAVEGGTGMESAEEALIRALDLAEEHISGGRAVCFGEVGRPHFPVPEEVMAACDRVLLDCMRRARRLGCAVIVHSEGAGDNPGIWDHLGAMADRAGLPRERVVKHFSGPISAAGENLGITPSVIAAREACISTLESGTGFMMETDYLDDPRRPGAVLGIRTVPRRTAELIQGGFMSQEDAWRVHVDTPLRVYGIDTVPE